MTDTTESWFVEAAAREEWPDGEAVRDVVLDVISDVLYVVDRRGQFVDWNDRFCERTGYTDAAIADLHQFDIIPEAAEAEAESLLGRVAEGEEVALEAPLVTSDGECIPHEFTAAPLQDDDGEVWGMVGTARDISELVETQEKLREREQRYATLVRNFPGMVYRGRSTPDSSSGCPMTFVSDGCAALCGYDPDAIESGEVSWHDDIVHPDDRAEAVETVQTALDEGEPFTVTYRIVTNDGTVRWVQDNGRCGATGTDGDAMGPEGFITDITERKHREQTLERYEQLIDTVGDGVYVLDEQRRVVEANHALEEMLGYDREELLGMPVSALVPDTDAEAGLRLRDQLGESDENIATIEGTLLAKDGTEIPAEGRFALLAESGYSTIGLVRDISERKERAALFEQLHGGMRRLMAAETTPEVATVAATVIQDYFDSTTTAVRLLRDDQLELVATEATDDYGDLILPTYAVGEGFLGEAYAAGEPVVYDDLRAVETPIDYDPARSVMLLPIPDYGLISVAATEPGVFDETDRELGRLFTADAEAAFERAERQQRLRERKRELEQYETLVETMGDGVYATDADNAITMVNDSLLEMAGRDRESVLGRQATEFGKTPPETIRQLRGSLSGPSEVRHLEDVFERPDGQRVHVENRFSLLPSDDGFRGTVGVIRDITDRKERETLVRDLHELSRDLLTAETREAVAERAAGAASRLGFPRIGVRLFDEEGRLAIAAREADMDTVGEGDLPAYEVGEGLVGGAYERGEPTIYDDLTEEEMQYDPSPIRSALFLPVEGYGLLSIGSTEVGAFDETDRELGRLFAADVEAALARADREQRLKAQRDQLETLNRINELVRETIGALATAPTREEIETTVVERLADSSLYQLAVTGTRPPDGDHLAYTARAGDGAEYLDRVAIPVGPGHVDTVPAADALQSGEIRVTRDVAAESVFEPFREAALENDLRSIADIPLSHGEVVHGLLAVYADRPDAFSDREIRAFEVLGEMVGFAISATQNRRLVESDSRLELTFRLTQPMSAIAALATDTGSRCRLLGSAETNDSGLLHYVSVQTGDEDAVLDSLRDNGDLVRDSRLVRATDDEVVVEMRSTESVPTVLLDLGLRPTEVRADGETVDVVVEAPQDCDVRAVTARLEAHGDVTLVSKQLVEEWTDPAETVREDLHEVLTDRQQAALNAAYFGGYFDWPRDSTAEDVADSLDISSATFHQHLRHAQRKVLAAYVADDLPGTD